MMRRPTTAVLIAASVILLGAILLLPSVLAPAPAEADTSTQPRVQRIGTLILQPPRLLLATPAPGLGESQLQLATPPPILRRPPVNLLPRWDRQYIVPTPEPQPNLGSCGDTLQGIEWTRITAPPADTGACLVTIQGNPGAALTFTVNPVIEGLGLQVQLVTPEGEELFSGGTDSPQRPLVITFTVPPNGEVMLVVYAAFEGEFEIAPQRVYFFIMTAQCGGQLEAGTERAGAVSPGGEECWYKFDGQAGHVLTVRMMKTDAGQLDPFLKLYDQGGDILTSDDDSGGGRDAELAYILPASQEFTIIARDYSRSAGGQFQIEAVDEVAPPTPTPTPRPSPPPAGGGGGLKAGVTMAGQLTTPTQKSVYTFSRTAGQNVKITLIATSGNLDPYLELYGANYPSGSRLAYNDDNPKAGGRNSQIDSYRLGSTGTYKVVVSSYAGKSTGAYKLTLSQP